LAELTARAGVASRTIELARLQQAHDVLAAAAQEQGASALATTQEQEAAGAAAREMREQASAEAKEAREQREKLAEVWSRQPPPPC
jgi:hypothetical protein